MVYKRFRRVCADHLAISLMKLRMELDLFEDVVRFTHFQWVKVKTPSFPPMLLFHGLCGFDNVYTEHLPLRTWTNCLLTINVHAKLEVHLYCRLLIYPILRLLVITHRFILMAKADNICSDFATMINSFELFFPSMSKSDPSTVTIFTIIWSLVASKHQSDSFYRELVNSSSRSGLYRA